MDITVGNINNESLQVFLESNEQKSTFLLNVLDGLTLTHNKNCAPSVLKCTILSDSRIKINEGDAVLLKEHGNNIFKGYITDIFQNEKGQMNIIAYDQLFYFKYKDTYFYENKSAGDILKKWASYFGLKTENIASGYRVPRRDEWNKPIRDMLKYAIEETYIQTGVLLVLFDKCGYINLLPSSSLTVNDYVIDVANAGGYTYSSSIASNTYNRVKLAYKNSENGVLEHFVASDKDKEQLYGILQYYAEIPGKDAAQQSAEQILKKTRIAHKYYSVKGVLSANNAHIYGGYSVFVRLFSDDTKVYRLMVDTVTHRWTKGNHLMDINFIAI